LKPAITREKYLQSGVKKDKVKGMKADDIKEDI